MGLSYRGRTSTSRHSYKETEPLSVEQRQKHRDEIAASRPPSKPQPPKPKKPTSIADFDYPVTTSSTSAGVAKVSKKSSYPTGKARQDRIDECFRIIREQQELRRNNK